MRKSSFALVRVLAMIGLAISAYLLIQKLNGTISSIKGCGGASGCANVLGSKWSQWFGIPVSAFSTVLYLGIIGLTFKPQRTALMTVVLLLVGAAIWFSLVQLLIIKAFCPWCFGTHLTGVLCAIAIWRALPSRPSGKSIAPALLPAGLGLAILIIGQAVGPEPKGYAISKETLSGGEPVPENSGERIIDMGTGKKFILGKSPFMGPIDAPHVLVKYFDYTCGSCQTLEGDLAKLKEKYPQEIVVVMNVTPLNRDCNPNIPAQVHNHEHSCELARLSLASWIAQPESFPEIHKILFTRPVLWPEQAKEKIALIIGEEKLKAALNDPEVDRLLASNTNDYKQLNSRTVKMPKLLIGKGKMLQGLMKDSDAFISAMEKTLPLK